MKKIFIIFGLLSVFFSLYAQNSLCLNSDQKNLINFPDAVQKKYDLSTFVEAYSFYGKNFSEAVNGYYCVFKSDDNSSKGSQNDSKILYVYKNGKKSLDILSISDDDFYIPQTKLKNELNREYIKFDNKGRVFLSVVHKLTNYSGIIMYSPAENHRIFFPLPENYQEIEDFEISRDGSYLIINGCHSFVNEFNGVEDSENQAFLFDTSKELESGTNLLYMNASKLSSIIYNPSTEAFYMIAGFNDYQLKSDEMGKICVLRKSNNSYSKESMEYYPQKEIEHGDELDFWHNNIVLNQLDNKVYVTNTPAYSMINDGHLCELTDNINSLSLKTVEQTSQIHIHKSNYLDISNVIQSTPLGLLMQDKNFQYYLYTNQILYPLTKDEFYGKLADYNSKLATAKAIALSNNQNNNIPDGDEIIEAIRDNVISTVNDYYEKLEKTTEAEELLEKYIRKNLILKISGGILFIIIIVLLVIIIYTHMNQKKNLKKEMQKKILELQESERAKLSRDIHDSVVQDIRAIRLQTDLIESAENPKAQVQKERVIEDITQVIVKMRNICYNLTPAELATHQEGDSAEIELISILDSLSQQFYVKTKIPCSVQLSEELVYPKFDKETSLHLVRIYQEILNNIEKHSYATNVRVLIRNKTENDQNYLVLFVIDDGIGCDIEQILKARKKNHFGLNNIRERVNLIGGKIEFFSSQNEGMKIIITVKM